MNPAQPYRLAPSEVVSHALWRAQDTYLVEINSRVHVVPVLHLDSQDVGDSQALQPLHGQGCADVRE